VLIFDEPTAALTGSEAQAVRHRARPQARGISMVYISHRMAEIFSCATASPSSATVAMSTDPSPKADPDDVVRKMVGREITQLYPDKLALAGQPAACCFRSRALPTANALLACQLRTARRRNPRHRRPDRRRPHRDRPDHLRPETGDIRNRRAATAAAIRIRSYSDAVKAGLVYLSEDRKGSACSSTCRSARTSPPSTLAS
jgi:ribose transport system ATP-binding protein